MKIFCLILSLICFLNSYSQSEKGVHQNTNNSSYRLIEAKYKTSQKQVDSIYMTLYASQPKYTFTYVQANSKNKQLTSSEKALLFTADSAAATTKSKIFALLNVYPLLSESSKKDVGSLFNEYVSEQSSLKQSVDATAIKKEALDNSRIFEYTVNLSKLDGKAEKTMNTVGLTSDVAAEFLNAAQPQPFEFRFLFKDSAAAKNYTAFLFPYSWIFTLSEQLKTCADNSWVTFLSNCQNYVSQQMGCHKWTVNINGKSEKLFSGPYQLVICDKSKVVFFDIVQVPVKDNVYPFTIQ